MIRIGDRVLNVYIDSNLKQQMKERSVKVDAKSEESVYIHNSGIDIEFLNYVRNVVPKIIHPSQYILELRKERGNYSKEVRQSKNESGFDDMGTGAAYAYASLHQKIVEGYRDGTREVYVFDNGTTRLATMDEELGNLNKAFEEMMESDQMVAKMRRECVEIQKKFQHKKFDELLDAYDSNQACDYIRDTYSEFRSRYLEQYEKNGGNVDIISLFSSILRNGNQGIYNYCKLLFETIRWNG